MVSQVRMPNGIATGSDAASSASDRATACARTSKCAVSPLIRQPSGTTARRDWKPAAPPKPNDWVVPTAPAVAPTPPPPPPPSPTPSVHMPGHKPLTVGDLFPGMGKFSGSPPPEAPPAPPAQPTFTPPPQSFAPPAPPAPVAPPQSFAPTAPPQTY